MESFGFALGGPGAAVCLFELFVWVGVSFGRLQELFVIQIHDLSVVLELYSF